MNPEKRDLVWIQVGRGFAALLVVFAHASLIAQRRYGVEYAGGFFSPGNIGVDFFFVLSGFIIVYVHRRDVGNPDRLRGYLAKRLTRIYPMYWLVSLAVLPVFLLLPGFGREGDQAGALFLLKSFLLVPMEPLPLLSVGWTLTHEMYFYLMFALAIAAPSWVWKTLVAIIVPLSAWKLAADWGMSWGGDKYRTGATFLDRSELAAFLFSRHNLEFVAGCAVAWAAGRFRLAHARILGVAGVALFVAPMIALALELPPGEAILHDRSARTVYYALVSALIVLAAANLDGREGASAPASARLLGDASYTLYLAHYPALMAIFLSYSVLLPRKLDFATVQLLTTLAVLLATAGCVLMYLLVEHPVLDRSRRVINRLLGIKPREPAPPAPAPSNAYRGMPS